MLRTRFVVFALFMVLSCFIVFPVYASWVQSFQRGDWTICLPDHWKANAGQYSGEALWIYNETLTNFVGYYANIKIESIDTWVTSWLPWDSSACKDLYVWHEFQGENTNIKVGINVVAHADLWGLIGKKQVYGCILINSTEYTFTWGIPSFLGSQNYVQVWVTKANNSEVNIKIYHYPNLLENPTLLEDTTINVGSQWFSHVAIKRYVRHDQYGGWTSRNDGKFEAYLVEENFAFTPQQFPEHKTFGENIWDAFIRGLINLVKPIPEWIRNGLNILYDSFKFITSLFGMFFNIAFTLLPLLVPIFILWFLSCSADCIDQGSFTPLAEMFYTIIDFVRGVIQTIANLLHAIWDIITFWS